MVQKPLTKIGTILIATSEIVPIAILKSRYVSFSPQQVQSDMLANLITPFRPTGPRVWYGIFWVVWMGITILCRNILWAVLST